MSSNIGLRLLIVAATLTYVSPFRTPFDTQPYALLLAVVLIAQKLTKERTGSLPGVLLLPVVALAAGSVSWLVYGATLVGARSLAGYATFALVAIAAYWNANSRLGLAIPILSSMFGLVALVQILFSKTFLSSVLPRLATSETRGVTSLTPEPSIFAILCVILLILNQRCYLQKDYSQRVFWATKLFLVMQIAIAGSTLGLLILILFQVFVVASRSGFSRIAVAAAAGLSVGSLWYLVLTQTEGLQDSRMRILVAQFLDSPRMFFFSDQSVAERAFAVHASVASLPATSGLGFGVGQWEQSVSIVVREAPSLLQYRVPLTGQDRLLSGLGTALVELGVVGFAIPLSLLILVKMSRARRSGSSLRQWCFSSSLLVLFVMTTSMPLAFPMFGLVFGLACHAVAVPPQPNPGGRSHTRSVLNAQS